MKPTRRQAQLLHKYFNKVLGYGNKCQCRNQASIKNVTENLVEFYCKRCNRTWGFELKMTLTELINKVI